MFFCGYSRRCFLQEVNEEYECYDPEGVTQHFSHQESKLLRGRNSKYCEGEYDTHQKTVKDTSHQDCHDDKNDEEGTDPDCYICESGHVVYPKVGG